VTGSRPAPFSIAVDEQPDRAVIAAAHHAGREHDIVDAP
jgi:hypothetical protein